MQGAKLHIDTRAPLYALVTSEDFKGAFAPGEQTGFIRDMDIPGRGMAARIGGRLLHSTDSSTSKAIEKLQSIVAAKLDAALSGAEIETLALGSTEEWIEMLARSIGEQVPQLPSVASMVPIVFASSERLAQERSKDIGRVLTAIETVT